MALTSNTQLEDVVTKSALNTITSRTEPLAMPRPTKLRPCATAREPSSGAERQCAARIGAVPWARV
jgi:hypothetical protein